MSLINQMLNDLEKRRSREQHVAGELMREVRASGRSRRRGVHRLPLRMFLFGSALAVIVAAGGRMLKEWRSVPAPSAEVPAVRVAIPMKTADSPLLPEALPPYSALPEAGEQLLAMVASSTDLASAGEPSVEVAAGQDNPPAASTPAAVPTGPKRHVALLPSKSAVRVEGEPVRAPNSPPAVGGTVPAPPATVEPVAGAMARVVRIPTPDEAAATAVKAGRAALTGGRLLEAEAHLRQAIAMAPDHHEGREELARVLVLQGRGGEAILLLQEGLQLAPSHLPFLKGYARLLAEGGDWKIAGELLHQVEAPPLAADPEFHALAAAVHQRQGDFAAAAERYRQLVALAPGNGTWWIGLGIALEGDGRGSEAGEAYRRGLAAGGAGAELAKYARERLTAVIK